MTPLSGPNVVKTEPHCVHIEILLHMFFKSHARFVPPNIIRFCYRFAMAFKKKFFALFVCGKKLRKKTLLVSAVVTSYPVQHFSWAKCLYIYLLRKHRSQQSVISLLMAWNRNNAQEDCSASGALQKISSNAILFGSCEPTSSLDHMTLTQHVNSLMTIGWVDTIN